MSWLFSQALVAAYSEANSSDGEPSAQLNVMPTQHPFWRNDRTTDFLARSRFGLTCAVLTENRGAVLLTSFQADSHARTSAWREMEPESTENAAGFGLTLLESLARFDPVSCSWKTRQLSLFEEDSELLEILPSWGMTVDGELFQRQIPFGIQVIRALITFGNASGFGELGRLPTMTVNTAIHPGRVKVKVGQQSSLSQELHKLPPPPPHTRLPTLTVQDSKNNGGPSQTERNSLPLNALVGGPLNPEWTEWFMGWPIGWTDLKPLEMDKYQQWSSSHGKH